MGISKPSNETETKLSRIAFLSTRDTHKQYTSLMHHFNEGSLKDCFNMLEGKKAVGIDGIDKVEYGKKLDENIQKLIEKMKRMAYIPGPVRQVMIPKEGKPGAKRPLGISNFEDKIVQKMFQRVLEAVYDPVFLGCSYGFRPGIGCHDAIRALHQHLYGNPVQTVIDVDISNYFGEIDHKMLEEILRERIRDPKFMRYIIRMFKAGILTNGELKVSEEGVVQGSCCSPILANLYAHHVIDEWFENVVKPRCKGKTEMFRYADDLVICCQYDRDAKRITEALGKRLAKYKLKLNEEKTQLVTFQKKVGNKAAFDFLGFTIYLGKSRKGYIIPKLKTIGKRLSQKLKRVSKWIRDVRNKMKLDEIWDKYCLKLAGHIRYYGVSFNIQKVQVFIHQSTRIMFKWLNRRSQRKSFNWETFGKYIKQNPLPKIKIYHTLFNGSKRERYILSPMP